MSASKIVCLAAIALILVVAFYKCPKKEGFRVANPPVVPPPAFSVMNGESSNVPLSPEHAPPMMALNGSQFRGYGDLVASPSLPSYQPKPEKMGEYMTPQMMMPQGGMEQGHRYRNDGAIPNENSVIAVNLGKNYLQDCIVSAFNLGGGDIPIVNSVHSFYGDREYYKLSSLISGTEYERGYNAAKSQDVGAILNEAERRLEIRTV
jgi:hypothetical protein